MSGVRVPLAVPLKGILMYKKLTHCKYCNIALDEMNTSERANHTRWCLLNPKRLEYVDALAKHREHIRFRRNQFTKARDEGRSIPIGTMAGKPGTFLGKTHTPETKQIIKEKALASSHRRLVRSIRQYTKKDGTIVNLDSSWEETLAKRLDELDVNWVRPDPIKWIDSSGVTHNYFPDFYLVDFDIYLDPKNPQAITAQQHKIECLMNQIRNIIILKSFEECKNFTP